MFFFLAKWVLDYFIRKKSAFESRFIMLWCKKELTKKQIINNNVWCVISINLNLDVIGQEVENVTVKNHIVNDDIDQVCFS